MHVSNSIDAEGRALPSQNELSGRSDLSVIQECHDDLQALLRSTSSRLQAIANSVPECDALVSDDLVSDDPQSNWLLRAANGALLLRPLPILAPPPSRDFSSEVATEETEVEMAVQEMTDDQVTVSFEPFSPLSSPRDAMDVDWRLSNGFDRNSYFGPTDFAPEAMEVSTDFADVGPLATVNSSVDLSQVDMLPDHSVARSIDTIKRLNLLKSHLSNQIRHN